MPRRKYDENFAARPPKKLRHKHSQETPRKSLAKQKNEFQNENNIAEYDSVGKYWQKIAELLEIAYHNVLDANETLLDEIEELKLKVAQKKRMARLVENLMEVLQGVLNDSGIDVNDISFLEDNTEEASDENAAD